MTTIARDSLLTLEAYAKQRPALRAEINLGGAFCAL